MQADPGFAVPVATRTLVAAGFRILRVIRQPSHIELSCERRDAFGACLTYLVVLMDARHPSPGELRLLQGRAKGQAAVLVVIAEGEGEEWLAWRDFLDALGGAVPTWRALSAGYATEVITLGANRLPKGLTGEAWRLYEDAVSDGLEFALGRRVRRLGGRRRGERVGDSIARTPDDQLLLIDAKASQEPFDVGTDTFRSLQEYTQRQLRRQTGDLDLNATLLVANEFRQDEARLSGIGNDFLGAVRIPLAFLRTASLVTMVDSLRENLSLRNKIRWQHLFCRIGMITAAHFLAELEAARREHVAG